MIEGPIDWSLACSKVCFLEWIFDSLFKGVSLEKETYLEDSKSLLTKFPLRAFCCCTPIKGLLAKSL